MILKSQHNILDSARTTMDSSKAIHFRFLLPLQCEEVNRYWLKMAFPMVHIDNKLRGWQKAKKQKWPGKYPELNTNTYSLKRGWRVSMGEKGLQRHWSECELTTPITGLVQGRNWSQDRDLSGVKETSNSLWLPELISWETIPIPSDLSGNNIMFAQIWLKYYH